MSMLTVAVSVAVLPALSVAVPVTCWAAPSVVVVTGAVQLATPEPRVGAAEGDGDVLVGPARRCRSAA